MRSKQSGRSNRFGLWALVCLALLALPHHAWSQAPVPSSAAPEILVLNAYHQGMRWTDSIIEGIRARFAAAALPADFQIEYLDTKRIDDDVYLSLVYDLFRHKFRHRRFNAVIASDDHAFSFLLQHNQALFGDTPVVFCGVNYFTPDVLVSHDNFTGVIEAFDIQRTVGQMLLAHPGLDEVVVINDRTKTGLANRKVIDAALSPYNGKVRFTFFEDFRMTELQERISRLPPTSAVLLMSFTRDKDGRVFDYEESLSLIAERCPVPIYGVWDFYLGGGIVGGRLTSGYHQGWAAAELTLQILSGRPARTIPVVTESPNRWMFDFAQLKRFGIPRAALPSDSILINEPISFYRRHKTPILVGGTVIAVQIVAIGLLMINVARRKRAEKELAASERLLKATLESTLDGVLAVDAAGSISHYNTRFAEIWSIPGKLLAKGQDAALRSYVEDQLVNPKAFQTQIDTLYQSTRRSEDLLEFKDGRMVERYSAPLTQAGRYAGRVWFFRDVTESRRKDEALRQSKRRLKQAQAMSLVGHWEFDLKTERFSGSEEAVRILGLQLDDAPLALEHLLDMVHPSDRARFSESLTRFQNGPQDLDIEFRIQPRAGEAQRWVHAKAQMQHDANGFSRNSIGTVQDITARVQAEESRKDLEMRLLHAQKMEAVGTLAGGIAHDFNNLLQTIAGYTQLLLMDKPPTSKDLRPLQQIEGAALRARDLARQMLTFSRKVESELVPSDLNRIVNNAAQMLSRTIPKMIHIELDLTPDLQTVNADANQIEQVLLNLGINAEQAMPDGGRLTIKTRNVHSGSVAETDMTALPPGPMVLLAVSDTGQGMDKNIQNRIFDPFFTTKGIGSGTGLGLSMVYGIVTSHGGRIYCTSEPGQGTTFKVYLPAIDQPAVAFSDRLPADPKDVPHGTETILLVDDEPAIIDLARGILERYGYRVLTASNGEEALTVYRRHNGTIHLVILDLSMPGMGGAKCLKRLLEHDPNTKVVIASGYSPKGSAREYLEAGALAFIGKPFELNDLLIQVRDALDRG